MSRQQPQQFTPALTVLLSQQEQQQRQQQQPMYEGTRLSSHQHQADPAPLLSPYRSKQLVKGLGRQQPDALNRKSAKGTLFKRQTHRAGRAQASRASEVEVKYQHESGKTETGETKRP